MYNKIKADYLKMSEVLNIQNVVFIPISAKDGDNVVNKSDRMPWYTGKPLLEYLETVPIDHKSGPAEFRYPVQYVIRPISDKYRDFRGYAGRVASGTLRVGDRVKVLPSGQESTVKRLSQAEEELDEIFAPLSVTIQLNDEIDISRGDILVKADEPQPQISQDVKMDVCWFNENPLQLRKKYIIRQETFETVGLVREIVSRRNINTLEKETGVTSLNMNDIAEISVHTASPLVFDSYRHNRVTGSLIFIDPDTNETVGAGMIL